MRRHVTFRVITQDTVIAECGDPEDADCCAKALSKMHSTPVHVFEMVEGEKVGGYTNGDEHR